MAAIANGAPRRLPTPAFPLIDQRRARLLAALRRAQQTPGLLLAQPRLALRARHEGYLLKHFQYPPWRPAAHLHREGQGVFVAAVQASSTA